jgi:hypothetical protein
MKIKIHLKKFVQNFFNWGHGVTWLSFQLGVLAIRVGL